ncbi:MAG: hypothetical protein D0433_00305 [Candidatus Thermochlorobacter aerophilum]|uniref:Uncharacterized protein n=1 Tax=Candidatus Thermochlorobacter aerophilus TaxID=1868324 RepID=A0A395M5L4_9BACT|nr:MAG: hypothetical protein D0433_00305 [Candidatus Thermochlorobacter aerophilum]
MGICYGCPIRVRNANGHVRTELLCQYGSVVDARTIVFDDI